MAFALLFAGLIMTVSAVRGTHKDLAALIKGDFTGPANFLYWCGAILLIGAIGYIPPLKKISMAFLGVILLGVILAKKNATGGGGLFAQLQNALNATTGPAYGGLGTGSTLHFGAAATAPGSVSADGTTGNTTSGSILPALPSLPSWSDFEGILAGAN